jgi:fatty-acid peroxygenase
VLLDFYATNHDPRLWDDPHLFRPERFAGRPASLYDLIPQGGGDPHTGHRCAGEGITVALVKSATRLLTTSMRYEVPPQDLRIDLSRMPAIPRSRFVIRNVAPIV